MKQNKFKALYETNSYVFENDEIKLLISHPDYQVFSWKSLDETIATVVNGIVKGVKKGNVAIRVFPIGNEEEYYDFNITVLSNNEPNVIKDLVKYHNSNIMVKRDFQVGKAYKTNIIESVNKLLFAPLVINDDLFTVDLSLFPECDLIVSNPPYIMTEEISDLQKEVLFEPLTALDGGTDGYDFYRCLSDRWCSKVKKNGYMAMECGEDQSEFIVKLFSDKYTETNVIFDFNNIDRVVSFRI